MMNQLLIDPIIRNALEEDYSWGDVTSETLISPETSSDLEFILKQEGVIAGLFVAERVFKMVDSAIIWQNLVSDGDKLESGSVIAKVSGKSVNLLIAERVALNYLQRMSGIASLTRQFVDEIEKVSSRTVLLDTRKTTPGLRLFEKYAVKMGGGQNHRYNLSDSVLIKDNHLAILKSQGISIQQAIETVKKRVPHTVKIEVEADSLEQVEEILLAGVDTILLDNMTVENLTKAVKMIGNMAKTEASGGVCLENIGSIASTGVDFISVGALTHSAIALDISLDFNR